MSTIETTVAAYGAAMRRERRSPKGIHRYMDCLRHLVEWDGGRDVREITKADLSAFEAWWWDDFEARNGREPAEATVAAMQVAVIQYFGYLEQEELIERNPARLLKKIKRTQRRNDWLRPDEDRASWPLRRTCGSASRDRLRHTGMRITEAVSVTNADVDMRDWTITVRKSKTDAGVRTIPVLGVVALQAACSESLSGPWVECPDAGVPACSKVSYAPPLPGEGGSKPDCSALPPSYTPSAGRATCPGPVEPPSPSEWVPSAGSRESGSPSSSTANPSARVLSIGAAR